MSPLWLDDNVVHITSTIKRFGAEKDQSLIEKKNSPPVEINIQVPGPEWPMDRKPEQQRSHLWDEGATFGMEAHSTLQGCSLCPSFDVQIDTPTSLGGERGREERRTRITSTSASRIG